MNKIVKKDMSLKLIKSQGTSVTSHFVYYTYNAKGLNPQSSGGLILSCIHVSFMIG